MFRLVFNRTPEWASADDDRVTSFEFVDRVNKVSRATFTINNYDYKYLDFKGFQKNFVFSFGTFDRMSKWFKTDLVKVTGSKELKIETHSMETRLMTRPISRFYEGTTLAGVLDVIAADYGMATDYDESCRAYLVPALNQINETDAQFLRRLAETHNYNFWIDGDILRFSSEAQSAVKKIPYGSLIEEPQFEFKFSKLRKKNVVKANKLKTNPMTAAEADFFGSETNMEYELAALAQEFGSVEGPQSIGLFDPWTDPIDRATKGGERTIVLNSQDYSTSELGMNTEEYNRLVKSGYLPEQAKALARTNFKGDTDVYVRGPAHKESIEVARSKAEAVKYTTKKIMKVGIKLIGFPAFNAGDSTELIGAPEILSGQWYIREAKYTWNGAFTTSLTLSKKGPKKKIEKDSKKLEAAKEAAKEAVIVQGVAESSEFGEAVWLTDAREPNQSIDPDLAYAATKDSKPWYMPGANRVKIDRLKLDYSQQKVK